MVAAGRMFLVVLLAFAALAAGPVAAAVRTSKDDLSDRILIASPSPLLAARLRAGGYMIESVECLAALSLSLMIVTPPRHVAAGEAVQSLRSEFPDEIIARDDPVYLAAESRPSRRQVNDRTRVLTSIGWQADGARVGANVHVGLIDTPIDQGHPALRGAVIIGRGFTSGKAATTDAAHGTAIATMLVGHSNGSALSGLLRGASLFHAGIFQRGKRGPVASSADFLRAVDWLAQSEVSVINASVTSPTENAVVHYAMSLLSHSGTLLVAAAGNRGPGGPPSYPAAIKSAFAVTAVSLDGEAYRHANTGDYIDIAAPGIDLPTTSRRITSGTSLAVPFVTAAVARLVELCGVAPIEAVERLQAGARDLGAPGRDSSFGWGLLQATRCAVPQISARFPVPAR